jgi:iron complex outermembrane receptor protein
LSQRALELSGQNIQFPVGPISALYRRYENLDRTRVSGLDMEIKHTLNLGAHGKVKTNLKANYQLDYRGWDAIDDAYTENLVGKYLEYKYNVRLNSSWTRGPMVLGATATYVPGTELVTDKRDTNNSAKGCSDRGIPAQYCRIEKDALLDVYGSYAFKNGFTGYINVYNITNREPTANVRSGNPPLRGRTLRLTAEYKF